MLAYSCKVLCRFDSLTVAVKTRNYQSHQNNSQGTDLSVLEFFCFSFWLFCSALDRLGGCELCWVVIDHVE